APAPAAPAPDSGSAGAGLPAMPGMVTPTDTVTANTDQPAPPPGEMVTIDPATLNWGPHSDGPKSHPRPLIKAQPEPEVASNPESIIPAPTHAVGAPTESGLFPGETAPPPLGTPEFSDWWDGHWRMMLQWAAQMMPKV
ncbi:hypothetical protein ACWELQ_40170, partial [Nocardia sp. NPDC004722]